MNAFRVAKFTEAIGEALTDPQLGVFRELVQSYEREHDVPAEDIAAAIAVLAQDGEPLFLEDMPEPPAYERRERREPAGGLVRWRIAVGKRHRVEPRQIVGALANEGGLKRSDFGRIDMEPNFSLVELPPDLSAETLGKLTDTRISGILIDLQRDKGPSSALRTAEAVQRWRSQPRAGQEAAAQAALTARGLETDIAGTSPVSAM